MHLILVIHCNCSQGNGIDQQVTHVCITMSISLTVSFRMKVIIRAGCNFSVLGMNGNQPAVMRYYSLILIHIQAIFQHIQRNICVATHCATISPFLVFLIFKKGSRWYRLHMGLTGQIFFAFEARQCRTSLSEIKELPLQPLLLQGCLSYSFHAPHHA